MCLIQRKGDVTDSARNPKVKLGSPQLSSPKKKINKDYIWLITVSTQKAERKPVNMTLK